MFFLDHTEWREESGPSFSFYERRKVDANGNVKVRHIGEPNEAMSDLHNQLRDDLAPYIDDMDDCVVGARKGFSVLSGIDQHIGNPYLYSLDIQKAYENV